MPKWIYDPKTCSMIPQKHVNDLDFQMTGAGFKISDHKHNLIFTIGPDDSISFNDRGIHYYLFNDYRTAAIVAQRIKRVYPNSKFGTPEALLSWRREKRNEGFSGEDKALLKSLSEVYESKELEKYINSINESHIADPVNPETSHGKTLGTTEHGLKGAVNALPSFILSFLICPPAAIIGWIGAVHERAEKRWLKTRINPGRWKDFIATPNEKKEQIKKKIQEEMARNNKYYIAELANGEIIRVVGSTTLEAREVVEKLEQEKYFRLAQNLQRESQNPNNKVWKVTFDDNEVTYIVGPENARQQLLAAAQKDKEIEVETYKKIYKEVTKQSLKGTGKDLVDDVLVPIKVPKADDIVILDTGYSGITENNYKKYKLYEGEKASAWNPSYNKYIIRIGNINDEPAFQFNLVSTNEQDLVNILEELKSKMPGILDSIDRAINEVQDKVLYKVATNIRGDEMILPEISLENHFNNTGEITSNMKRDVLNKLQQLGNPIEEAIYMAVMDDKISKETKLLYKRYISSNPPKVTGIIGAIEDNQGNEIPAYTIKYANIFNNSEFKAIEIDLKTQEETEITINLPRKAVIKNAA